jgi:glucosamine-6-phosphate deaminase
VKVSIDMDRMKSTEIYYISFMNIDISADATELGIKAAEFTAFKLNNAIFQNGGARLLVSTGNSQLETFRALVNQNVDWSKVEMFHLDEYMGLSETHAASFRKYLSDRFVSKVKLKRFHSVDVEGNIDDIILNLTKELRMKPVDLGLIGIGVNGHIAFNDPPADFNTHEAFKVVILDEQCRMQQVNEGWFSSLDEVPTHAISMTPWQIMQCKTILSCVPYKVKAMSVRNTLINKTTNLVPATLLKQHADFHLYLDIDSASEIIVI